MTIENIFNELVECVIKEKGSDLYILPSSNYYRIMMITNNGLKKLRQVEVDIGLRLLRYIKFCSGMDISETRRPQLSRMTYQVGGTNYNCRISSVGDFLNQESMVIRFLYQICNIGIKFKDPEPIYKLIESVKNMSGLILLSGRTGVGKTSTLYYAIQQLKTARLVLSIEDPVEIEDSEILQLQINTLADMSYQQLLKLALRHHPEILIIGEIRDSKTAKIAVEAGMSGHLVLSTVHADSCLGVWYRMLGLGVDEWALKHVLSGVGYQIMTTVNAEKMADLQYLTQQDLLIEMEKNGI
ncbi:competence type IV pilus ATPase ComGA [Weissella koreensis]|uniref:Competence protein ComG n=1 Tax=Weissella koreensis TaxID=165096 RepID=A0A7H1MK99_9LACO|nr:competence type IV pilus ATPase ComGA [Weissella koreensis]AVH74627.1 competence protein ComG [Weissella koreensis]EJF33979.1 hypothetical protein JC2156_02870 [Weissella koreensis KCTC 3621]EJF34269.1 hypothetical protein JC2156_01510 [Weissella koreensis KCTC 3621]QGN19850.1 competence protein ComG [Weissella koreensis]QNT63885.1 competence protein ComG [Weissella koreensis]